MRGKIMNSENFVYWLQGFFEIGKSEKLTQQQVEEIINHLEIIDNASLVNATPRMGQYC